MKVLLFAPVFAMVAIGLVYGDCKDKEVIKALQKIITEQPEGCESGSTDPESVTLFISHYAASVIQEGT